MTWRDLKKMLNMRDDPLKFDSAVKASTEKDMSQLTQRLISKKVVDGAAVLLYLMQAFQLAASRKSVASRIKQKPA